jgi:hypothetical protein
LGTTTANTMSAVIATAIATAIALSLETIMAVYSTGNTVPTTKP